MLWLGTATGMEATIVRRSGVPFRAIPARPIVGTGPVSLVRGIASQARGAMAAWRMMGPERPDVVFVTGGYVAVPVAVAAHLRRVPLGVFLPDVRPGRAVALITRMADVITTTAERARGYLPPEKTVVTGYPVRQAVRDISRGDALQALGLTGDRRVLLVFGGSRGARTLNNAVREAAPRLLERLDLLHVSGTLDHHAAGEAREALPEVLRSNYHLYEYLHGNDMAAALASADLVVSRAGAAVMGEYPARRLPAILVPLPIAGGHQRLNAEVLSDAGAAVIIDDEELDGERLHASVTELLDSPERLARMREAGEALDRPDAARDIWRALRRVAAAAVPAVDPAQRSIASDPSTLVLLLSGAAAVVGYVRGAGREIWSMLLTGLTFIAIERHWPAVVDLVNRLWDRVFHGALIEPTAGSDVWQMILFILGVLGAYMASQAFGRPPSGRALDLLNLPNVLSRLVGALCGAVTGYMIGMFSLKRLLPNAEVALGPGSIANEVVSNIRVPVVLVAILILVIFGVLSLGGRRKKVYG